MQITFRHRVSLFAYRLLSQKWFEHLMTFLILFNTVLMAAEHYGQSKAQTDLSSVVNYIVTAVFTIEMLVKHAAYGFKLYWTSGYDAFDGLVIMASIADIVVGAVQKNSGASAISALRCLRLLRVLKLARSWKELQKIIDAIFRAVGSIGYLSLLVLLFTIIFALLGMQLFGDELQFCDAVEGSFQHCPLGEPCPRYRNCYLPCLEEEINTWVEAQGSPYLDLALCEQFPRNATLLKEGEKPEILAMVGPVYRPRFTFDNFFFAMITVFQCLSQDGWSMILFDCMRSTDGAGRYVYIVYFLLLMIVGLYIMLNLFLAILLDGFSMQEDEEDKSTSRFAELRKILGGLSFNKSKTFLKQKSRKFLKRVTSRGNFRRYVPLLVHVLAPFIRIYIYSLSLHLPSSNLPPPFFLNHRAKSARDMPDKGSVNGEQPSSVVNGEAETAPTSVIDASHAPMSEQAETPTASSKPRMSNNNRKVLFAPTEGTEGQQHSVKPIKSVKLQTMDEVGLPRANEG